MTRSSPPSSASRLRAMSRACCREIAIEWVPSMYCVLNAVTLRQGVRDSEFASSLAAEHGEYSAKRVENSSLYRRLLRANLPPDPAKSTASCYRLWCGTRG